MSSSSSYSSSPPSSPTHTRKYYRINTELTENNDTTSCDESKTTPTTTASVTNHSSNESVNQDEFMANDSKKNEDIEASYITNVSKNPITLRKTESLRIETVQSIRNRFDRVNSVNVSRSKDPFNISIDENQAPNSPPNLISSPMSSSFNKAKQTTPVPLLLNTSNNSSFGQTANNESNVSLNGSCIKKRVWTPVQSSSNLANPKLDSNIPNNFNDVREKNFFTNFFLIFKIFKIF